ncbi:transcriptional regulator, TetR family [Actinacidiphila alni]|uniref:Transcriptional regulator, TetR family n=1 Tax=Actinacidiphila alni TaxID=380248 RepID=A0A1I2JVW7_9ACTN|nr:TetR/AcrR family transcriptional regulator [Actinacidiphila alni]SFF56941.1 transcriptional regulator, TetR family [Actinacidiphila alni]
MSVIKGARERARIEVTAAIKQEASKQLAAEGAARLSLRAVARELGMVSSALYRYFPSRDELLTALIIDAYDAIGAAAEQALAGTDGEPPADRWVAVCRAVGAWAVAHPHEYALIYGSPVPGYTAPDDTVGPASRAAFALITIVRDAHRDGLLQPPPGRPLAAPVRADAARLAAEIAPELPIPTIAAIVAVWAQLFGVISFEVFGQFNRMIDARREFLDQAAAGLALQIGLGAAESPAEDTPEGTIAATPEDATTTIPAPDGVLRS